MLHSTGRRFILGLIPLSALFFSTATALHNTKLTTFHDFFTVTVDAGITPAIKYLNHDGDIMNDADYPLSCNGTSCNFAITDDSAVWSKGTVTYQVGDNTNNQPYCIISISDGSFIGTPSIKEASCFNGAYETKLSGEDHHYNFAIKLNPAE
jgi:hypothetical protein